MKSCISNLFFDYGDAPLTLFIRLKDENVNHSLLMLLSFPQFFYEVFKNIIIAHKL